MYHQNHAVCGSVTELNNINTQFIFKVKTGLIIKGLLQSQKQGKVKGKQYIHVLFQLGRRQKGSTLLEHRQLAYTCIAVFND